MKNIATLSLLAVTNLAALNIGERYDFICTDGQDIYNAELVVEDAERYFVRLSPVMSRVPIEKKYVIRTVPRTITVEKPTIPVRRRYEVSLAAGADASLGKLSGFARIAPVASASLVFWAWNRWGFFGRAEGEEFRSGSSYLRAFSAFAGIAGLLPVYPKTNLSGGLGVGASYLIARSSTFSDSATVLSGVIWLRTAYDLYEKLSLFLEISARYYYDRDTAILAAGAQVGAIARW